jgi:hypothetical protein
MSVCFDCERCWSRILETLVSYRLIDPGSEWRLHRLWFEPPWAICSANMKNALYRCRSRICVGAGRIRSVPASTSFSTT